MPEDRFPPLQACSETKSSAKHKWRGKLFSSEGRFARTTGDLESTEDDVANFLQTATTKPKAEGQPAEFVHRINTAVAAQLPAPLEIPQNAETEIVDVYRRPKPRQNKGLRVKFETAAPTIIGVGGEEAELPSIQVLETVRKVEASELPRTERLQREIVDSAPQDSQGTLPVPIQERSLRATSLQRRPTGLSDILDDQIVEDQNHNSSISATSALVSTPTSKPLPQPPHQAQDDEVYGSKSSPQHAYRDLSPLRNSAYDLDEQTEDHKPSEISNGVSSSLSVPFSGVLAGNSLSPVPAPEPPSAYQEPSTGYGFPPSDHTRRKPLEPNPPITLEVTKEDPALLQAKPHTLRNIAKGLVDDSLDDFDGRVRRFNDIFRLGISAHIDLMEVPFAQWIMIAAWWFIMGREGLESEVRNQGGLSPTLKQAYVNLAKSWWIVKEITPTHPEVTRYGKASMNSLCAMVKSLGNHALAELADVHMGLIAHMRALTMSMKRNGKLPPSDLEIRGLNLHVLLRFPSLPTDVAESTVNNSSRLQAKGRPHISESFFPILIGDTERHFSFARMSVEVVIRSSDKSRQDIHMPCVLTVLRERSEWGVQVAIASQDSQINLVVSDAIPGALTWRSVKWDIPLHEMVVGLPNDMDLLVKLSEKDFKTIWGICDYARKIRKEFQARNNETLVFERILARFQCDDAGRFPSESITDCRLRVFEKKSGISGDPVQRCAHSGYRLAVITPPHSKTLNSVNYELGREYPAWFRIQRDTDGPRLVLKILPSSIRLCLTFHEAEDIDTFRHLLSGTSMSKEDRCSPSLQVQYLAIGAAVTDKDQPKSYAGDLTWRKLRVVNKGPLPSGRDTLSTVGSDHLRILADCDFGTLADRISLAPGELQLSLDVARSNEIKLLRPPQSDMIFSLTDDRVAKEELDSIRDMLSLMLTSSTVRSYHFRSMSDAHSFQAMVTGFSVLYDQVVSSFAISRRRTVVPISKRWEAASVRLQIIKQDKTVQLVAFFKDFSHGSCMNFVLKFTDTFESFSKTGILYLRIVDAKFALPKAQEHPSRDFVCLDTPEYPGEHDDVTIGFDNENDRERFGEALPAQVNKMSRMASLRR